MPIRTARKASQIVPRTSSAATRNLQACTPSLSATQIHLTSQVDADRTTLVETLVVQHCMFLCPASASHGLGRADTQICLSRGQCCCPDDRPEICVPECRGKWTRRKLWNAGGNGHGGSSGDGTDQDVMLSSDDVVRLQSARLHLHGPKFTRLRHVMIWLFNFVAKKNSRTSSAASKDTRNIFSFSLDYGRRYKRLMNRSNRI
jgi:hypothetical protein